CCEAAVDTLAARLQQIGAQLDSILLQPQVSSGIETLVGVTNRPDVRLIFMLSPSRRRLGRRSPQALLHAYRRIVWGKHCHPGHFSQCKRKSAACFRSLSISPGEGEGSLKPAIGTHGLICPKPRRRLLWRWSCREYNARMSASRSKAIFYILAVRGAPT